VNHGFFIENIQDLDLAWDREETDYLWDLCERFDLRFFVVYDQYDLKYNRSMEDLKERFYQVSKKLVSVILSNEYARNLII